MKNHIFDYSYFVNEIQTIPFVRICYLTKTYENGPKVDTH